MWKIFLTIIVTIMAFKFVANIADITHSPNLLILAAFVPALPLVFLSHSNE